MDKLSLEDNDKLSLEDYKTLSSLVRSAKEGMAKHAKLIEKGKKSTAHLLYKAEQYARIEQYLLDNCCP